MDAREEKGLQIAATGRIRHRRDGLYVVPSQAGGQGAYIVDTVAARPSCTCPDHELRAVRCKHMFAVEFARKSVVKPDGTETTVETMRITYSQNWPAYNSAQQHEEERAAQLLRAACDAIPVTPYAGNGRPSKPLSEMVFSMVLKVYGGMSSRRAQSDLRAAVEKGHVDAAPHYNTICKYMEDPRVTPVLERLITQTALPLKAIETSFAVDSSGFASNTYKRWFDAKYGKEMKTTNWVKAHVMSGVVTNVVTAVKMTDERGSDPVQFPGLLETTAEHFAMAEVSADKAYSSKANLEMIVARGATPYVAFRSTTTADSLSRLTGSARNPLWERLWHFYEFNRSEFLSHYNKRSNAESVFSAVKRKFGANVRSKLPVAQQNEVLCKFVAHNLACLVHSIFELGIEPKFWPEA
jgi:transposase